MARTTIQDSGWQEIRRKLKQIEASEIEVGILGESALETDGSDFRLVDVAIVNEFGTEDGHIPERPAHRQTYDAKQSEIQAKCSAAVHRAIAPGGNPQRELNRVGLWYSGELKKTIITYSDPPNAPATIAKKGDDNPLIDTHRMLESIHHKIKRR